MPITASMADEAKRQIVEFVSSTRSLIRNVIREDYRLPPDVQFRPYSFIEDVRVPLFLAWEEFDADFAMEDVEGRVSRTSPEILRAFGLYGAQLRAKLKLIKTLTGRFVLTPTRAILAQLLEAIDVLLDSVIKATGIYESIKEIKDLTKSSLETD